MSAEPLPTDPLVALDPHVIGLALFVAALCGLVVYAYMEARARW